MWKPTADECRIIRDAGKREGGSVMEIGLRYNMNDNRESINIAMLTSDEDWTDTDLVEPLPWSTFRAGVPLTEDGRAIVDFYVHSRGYDGQLEGNVTVYYANGRIERIYGTMGNVYYETSECEVQKMD